MRLLATTAILFFFSAVPAMAEVRLWRSTTTTSGDMGGRAGADAICDADANRPAGLSNVRAFISLSGSDEIRDMATNYGIPTTEAIRNQDDSLQISSDFSGLLNAGTVNLDNSVASGGGGALPWTFSDADGALNANNCTGGTSTAGIGVQGHPLQVDGRYLNNSTNNCTAGQALYCLSWESAAMSSGAQSVPTNTPWSFALTVFFVMALLQQQSRKRQKTNV
ncbi:hypothetical protein [Pseudoteredinibacter isoporae]|uniref:hypothetical protein n=1 Tax=Pseudoteredinibacter isoporae TaxID=570281 RepID=UPI003102AE2D